MYSYIEQSDEGDVPDLVRGTQTPSQGLLILI